MFEDNFCQIKVWMHSKIDQTSLFCVFIPLPSKKNVKTRSSWLNCALRDDEAVYWVSIRHFEAVAVGVPSTLDDTGSVEDMYAFIYCTKWRSGRVLPMPDWHTTLKDRATQLPIKYKSGALVTQFKDVLGSHPWALAQMTFFFSEASWNPLSQWNIDFTNLGVKKGFG